MGEEQERPSQPFRWDDVPDQAKDIFLGELKRVPTLVIEGEIQGAVVQFDSFPQTVEQRMMLMLMKGIDVARNYPLGDLIQITFISDAWTVEGNSGSQSTTPPSQNLYRRDVVAICHHVAEQETIDLLVYEMVLDQDDHVVAVTEQEPAARDIQYMNSALLDAFVHGYQLETERGLRP